MIITAKRLGALAVVAALSTSGYAFMNANLVSSSGAGSGSGPVYGYNISNISYSVAGGKPGMGKPGQECQNSQNTPGGPGGSGGPGGPGNGGTGGRICDVTLEASPQVAGQPAAANVFVAFNDSNGDMLGSYQPCTLTAGPDASNNTFWECQVTPAPQALHPITSLDVRATS